MFSLRNSTPWILLWSHDHRGLRCFRRTQWKHVGVGGLIHSGIWRGSDGSISLMLHAGLSSVCFTWAHIWAAVCEWITLLLRRLFILRFLRHVAPGEVWFLMLVLSCAAGGRTWDQWNLCAAVSRPHSQCFCHWAFSQSQWKNWFHRSAAQRSS